MFEPVALNLPPCPLKLRTDGKRFFVFDELRRKDLVCTPEEWVRQHWIHYLMREKQYPKGLIRPEASLEYNGMRRRSDLLIYNAVGGAVLLAEFKRPSVPINEEVLNQVARYNFIFKIPLVLVSNGLQHFYWTLDADSESYRPLQELPPYCQVS